MFSLLYTHFEKHVPLTDHDREIIASLYRHRKFRKHQYILQHGEICRYETFIVKGCTRTYDVDERGQEHVLQFGVEGWWVGNMYSFLSGEPSDVNVDCIEDTEVLQISKTDLETLYERLPKIERYFRLLVQNAYIAAMNRISSNLSLSAAERYHEFVTKYPFIHQRVPNHLIASYLGITPQSLSRLRSKAVRAQ